MTPSAREDYSVTPLSQAEITASTPSQDSSTARGQQVQKRERIEKKVACYY